jgi:signal transduction histidine kinase
MNFDFVNRWRRSAVVLPLAALTALFALLINESAYRSSTTSLESLGERGTARLRIQAVLRGLIDAETGQRGFLLTGRDDYLAPYTAALVSVREAQAWLARYYDKDAVAEPKLDVIKADTDAKLAELAQTLTLYRQGNHAQWREMLMSDSGKRNMDRIRENSLFLLQLESDRIAVEREEVFRTLRLSRIGVATMVALSLLALVMFLRQTALLDAAQRSHAAELKTERDHLELEVGHRTAELTQLAENLQTAREDERGRIARELHDELGALLTAAKLDAARLKRSLAEVSNTEIAERLAHLTHTLNDGIGLKRRIIEDLRPSSLSNLGLKAAIEILATEIGQRADLKITTQIEPFELDEAAEITLYRMVQESLTNVVKYAAASEVHVHLTRDDNQISALVSDNGRGFDTNRVRGSAQGLVGMRYRVQARGGRLQVRSTPGQGTTVSAILPVSAAAGGAGGRLS